MLRCTFRKNLDGNLIRKIETFRNDMNFSLEQNFHFISIQRNACIFVKKSRANFALARYTYHFVMF